MPGVLHKYNGSGKRLKGRAIPFCNIDPTTEVVFPVGIATDIC